MDAGYRAEFYPYGFPAIVVSNSPAPLEAAHASWGGLPRRYDEAPIELRCLVAGGGGTGAEAPPAPTFRAQGNLLAAVVDAENFWCSDMVKGFAFGWVTMATANRMDYLRYHFVEAMAYSLLDSLHVTALHAACVSLDGQGVLLAGDSGAGKSSLAYACARRGWVYCSDDSSVLVRRSREPMVLGNPRVFRFRASAGSLFPEFGGMRETRRAGGKPTIEISTESLSAIRTSAEAFVSHIVFLNRRIDAPVPTRLRAVTKRDAMARLFQCPWPRELPMYTQHKTATRRLLGARLVEMEYHDLDSAVDQLERLVRER